MRRLLRWLLLIVALPLVLSLAYRFVPPVSTLMLARWLTLQPVERSNVRLGDVAPVMPLAVLIAEDTKFCSHGGVDWAALQEVLDDEDEPSRGASTLTQQVVKNLFLWHGRSYVRKAIEIPLALWFDLVVPKRRQLEIYLNIAEWGDGLYGVEAASRRFFGKGARVLSQREAVSLAAALPSPLTRNPMRPAGAHRLHLENITRRLGREALDTSCLSS